MINYYLLHKFKKKKKANFIFLTSICLTEKWWVAKGFVTFYLATNLILVFWKPLCWVSIYTKENKKSVGQKQKEVWEPSPWTIPCLVALPESTRIPGTMILKVSLPSSRISWFCDFHHKAEFYPESSEKYTLPLCKTDRLGPRTWK